MLSVLDAGDGTVRWFYQPSPSKSGWSVSCQSGVTFGELEGVGTFGVYAIIDRPSSTESNVGAER